MALIKKPGLPVGSDRHGTHVQQWFAHIIWIRYQRAQTAFALKSAGQGVGLSSAHGLPAHKLKPISERCWKPSSDNNVFSSSFPGMFIFASCLQGRFCFRLPAMFPFCSSSQASATKGEPALVVLQELSGEDVPL